MPVLDHPVHPLTIGGQHYGCHNRGEFAAGYWAPDREYREDGTWQDAQRFIPHTMSKGCRYDKSLTDSKCAGCKRRGQGEEYVEEIRRNWK